MWTVPKKQSGREIIHELHCRNVLAWFSLKFWILTIVPILTQVEPEEFYTCVAGVVPCDDSNLIP